MKAIKILEPGKVATDIMDMPAAGPGEVLLRIKYVGFCGSDLNTFLGRNPMVKMPVIPGHEIGAEVEALGEGVSDRLKVGMTVTVDPYTGCGECASCRRRRANACEHNETLGVQRNGAMREYLVVPASKVIPCPGLDSKTAALVEPMSVGFHAVSRGGVTDTDTVVVIGCGMIGVGAIVRSALRGARVVAIDIDDEKLKLARRLGAAATINSLTQDVAATLRELTEGYMADVVIEAVGSPATYVTAIDIVGFTGRVVCIGYAKSDVSFQTKYFVQKELDIRGSRNALPEDFRAVIKYLEKGACPVSELISAVIQPEEAGEALMKWAQNPGKVFRILTKF